MELKHHIYHRRLKKRREGHAVLQLMCNIKLVTLSSTNISHFRGNHIYEKKTH